MRTVKGDKRIYSVDRDREREVSGDRGGRGLNINKSRGRDETLQGSAKRRAPGCVNVAGKAGRNGKLQQEQNSPNLVKAF